MPPFYSPFKGCPGDLIAKEATSKWAVITKAWLCTKAHGQCLTSWNFSPGTMLFSWDLKSKLELTFPAVTLNIIRSSEECGAATALPTHHLLCLPGLAHSSSGFLRVRASIRSFSFCPWEHSAMRGPRFLTVSWGAHWMYIQHTGGFLPVLHMKFKELS